MSKIVLSQEKLKELLYYDPNTGIFKWLIKRNGCKSNMIAGYNQHGYINIAINNNHYMAHRLAWLYVYGYFPENEIDHINRKRNDNRIVNLREVSRQCNLRNSSKSKNNTSGITGISFDKKRDSWRAYIGIEKNKLKNIGYFKLFNDAVIARWNAEKELGYTKCCTESTSYKYLKENGLL